MPRDNPSAHHARSPRTVCCSGLVCGLAAALALAPCAANGGAGSPTTVDFSRDIAPTLSEHCFSCHGPDAKARKAGLRLDTEEGALGADDPVIVPGKSEESELFFRVASRDEA